MNDTKTDMVVDIPAGLTAEGITIVSQPNFEEIKRVSDQRSGAVSIGCVVTSIRNGGVVSVKHVELQVSDVRDVIYDVEQHEIRFTGKVVKWHRSPYRRPELIECTCYQVVLRDQVSDSVMYPIRNPHPVRPYH